ncbi:MAG TPA: VOC family protein [Jatrophihabitans sp.]|jgi:catechol 2,3-dioxygenase-like lactoylglutathione lyase family enzyme
MAIATFKDLCIDTTDLQRSEQFWSQALGLQRIHRDGNSWLAGPTANHTIWINEVPEPRTAKNRVHLDVLTRSLDELTALGATVVEHYERWTIMTDPEGQEFCAFVVPDRPELTFKDLVVDSNDPERIATWWHGVFGGVLGHHPNNPWWWLDEIPGAVFESMDFVEVPEPKTVKNRVHWDVSADSIEPLIDAGAVLLRPKGGDIGWHVMADPDGNEFCAFTP